MIWLLAFLQLASAAWVPGVMHVRDDNSKQPVAIFLNTYTGVGPAHGQWQNLDVTTLGIPAEAKSLFLSGRLLITHGSTNQICDLTITFRAPGDTLPSGSYISQTIESWVGGGQRSAMSSWAPIRNGKIEYFWNRNTLGQWPSECAYGINLSAQAYLL